MKAVIFDLDGTLLNTINTIKYYCDKALLEYGFNPVPIEKYKYFVGNKEVSIYLENMPVAEKYENAESLKAKYAEFMNLRNDVLKALENARNAKIIGKSFSAKLSIKPTT